MFKIIALIIITLFVLLYVGVCIFLTRGKHLHDHIISIIEVWAYKTNLPPPSFIEVPVPRQESVVFVFYFVFTLQKLNVIKNCEYTKNVSLDD